MAIWCKIRVWACSSTVERLSYTQYVGGPNPPGPTKNENGGDFLMNNKVLSVLVFLGIVLIAYLSFSRGTCGYQPAALLAAGGIVAGYLIGISKKG